MGRARIEVKRWGVVAIVGLSLCFTSVAEPAPPPEPELEFPGEIQPGPKPGWRRDDEADVPTPNGSQSGAYIANAGYLLALVALVASLRGMRDSVGRTIESWTNPTLASLRTEYENLSWNHPFLTHAVESAYQRYLSGLRPFSELINNVLPSTDGNRPSLNTLNARLDALVNGFVNHNYLLKRHQLRGELRGYRDQWTHFQNAAPLEVWLDQNWNDRFFATEEGKTWRIDYIMLQRQFAASAWLTRGDATHLERWIEFNQHRAPKGEVRKIRRWIRAFRDAQQAESIAAQRLVREVNQAYKKNMNNLSRTVTPVMVFPAVREPGEFHLEEPGGSGFFHTEVLNRVGSGWCQGAMTNLATQITSTARSRVFSRLGRTTGLTLRLGGAGVGGWYTGEYLFNFISDWDRGE